MKDSRTPVFLRAAALCCVFMLADPAAEAGTTGDFPVFCGFWYQGMPSPSALGLRNIHILDRNPDNSTPISEQGVAQQLREISKADPAPLIVFDIESPSYPLDIRSAPKAKVDQTMRYFEQLIDWTRRANPVAKVGFYGLPLGDYWTTNLRHTAQRRSGEVWWKGNGPMFEKRFQEWRAANAHLAPLIRKIDYLFPSLYTNYEQFDSDTGTAEHGWRNSAEAILAEAKTYGKPVYPFVWPQFHEGAGKRAYEYLPIDFWKKELEFVRANADGVVLWAWGGYLKERWDDDAPWWRAAITAYGIKGLSLSFR